MIVDVLAIIWLHFFADFMLQSDSVAVNKGKNVFYLMYHCCIYMIPFGALFGIKFALINGLAHFLVDLCSSQLTTKFHKSGNRSAFFNTIGFDQAIHLTILFLTYMYLPKG
jgi:hypothetical protein